MRCTEYRYGRISTVQYVTLVSDLGIARCDTIAKESANGQFETDAKEAARMLVRYLVEVI